MKPGLMKRRRQGNMPAGINERMEEMQEPNDNPQEEQQEQTGGLMKRGQQGNMPGSANESREEMQEPNDNPQEERQEQSGGNEQEQVEQALKPAVAALYGDNFDAMVNMFKTNGVERFGDSMSTAINGVLEKIEQNKPLPPEIAAGVGMKLFFMLLEDIVTGGVLPQLDVQTIQQALALTIKTYADTHDNITEQDMQQFFQQLAQAERAAA